MSPLILRRYRAERLLKSEFEGLRERVLAVVGRRLRGAGVDLDDCDLEACYAMAWQGLYAAVLDGQEIANPSGWLVLVTFRRAIEEHRARLRAHRGGDRPAAHRGRENVSDPDSSLPALDRDLAAELDDRVRLRQLFEGLRGRLSAREREAATLCYLQGLSRAQAARRMGVSDARMRKLMEGRGPGTPGVAGKVGALVETIRDGRWCDEQGSLMRGLAFGILDPGGERHRLAVLHHGECPACRAYVASLRGLSVVLPPALLPGGFGAAVLAGAAGASRAAHAGVGAGAQLGRGLGNSFSSSSAASAGAGAGGAAGGAASGGWLLAGGGKLAIGCALALSVGTGCVAIDLSSSRPVAPVHTHPHPRAVARGGALSLAKPGGAYYNASISPASPPVLSPPASTTVTASPPAPAAAKASREFGPEQALASASPVQPSTSTGGGVTRAVIARAAATSTYGSSSGSGSGGGGGGVISGGTQASSASTSSGGGSSQATREFSPG